MNISFLICVREREIMNVFMQPTSFPQTLPICQALVGETRMKKRFVSSVVLVNLGDRQCSPALFMLSWSYTQHTEEDGGGR